MNLLTHLAVAPAIALLLGTQAPAPPKNNNQPVAAKPVAAQAQPAPDPTVMVASGDSLSSIAGASSTTWQRLYDKNTQISDPDLIYPGESLTIPASNEALAERPLPAPAPVSNAPVAVEASSEAAPANTSSQSSETPSAPSVASGSIWDAIAACESSGNWSANTGNGFYGGLQFTLASWQAVGGSGLPSNASRDEQIYRASLLQARQGWGAWPVCSVKAGLSS